MAKLWQRFIVFLLILLAICVPVALRNPMVVYSIDDYKLFSPKSDVDTNKVWTININKELDRGSINSSNIQVLDENEKPVSVNITLDPGNKTVQVKPLNNYEQGKTYHLVIKDKIKSNNGKNLSKGIVMYFTTKKTGSAVAKVNKAAVNITGQSINIIELTIKSCSIKEATMVKFDNSEYMVSLGQAQRYVAVSDSVNVGFYTQDGEYVGSGVLNISNSNDNISFDIDRSGGI